MKQIKLLLLIAVAALTTSATSIAAPQLQKSIKQFIQTKYPGAVIIDQETKYLNTEVEIIYKNKEIDMVFDENGKWLKSKWDMQKSETPKAVLNAIKSSAFKSYKIDDIEYFEDTTKKYYKVDLEKLIGDKEATLYITPDGKIL